MRSPTVPTPPPPPAPPKDDAPEKLRAEREAIIAQKASGRRSTMFAGQEIAEDLQQSRAESKARNARRFGE